MTDRVRAIIIREKKFLLVSDGKEIYWSPGGHQESGEDHRQTLERELNEELGVKLITMVPIGKIIALNHAKEDGATHYYLCTIEGDPVPNNEIKECIWFSFDEFNEKYPNRGHRLYPIIEKLHSKGRL